MGWKRGGKRDRELGESRHELPKSNLLNQEVKEKQNGKRVRRRIFPREPVEGSLLLQGEHGDVVPGSSNEEEERGGEVNERKQIKGKGGEKEKDQIMRFFKIPKLTKPDDRSKLKNDYDKPPANKENEKHEATKNKKLRRNKDKNKIRKKRKQKRERTHISEEEGEEDQWVSNIEGLSRNKTAVCWDAEKGNFYELDVPGIWNPPQNT